jgi:ubiquinol-cytochrome c reductase cytochrome b subunit
VLLFVIAFIGLGYLGTQPATPGATMVARVLTAVYFGFFLLMPLYTRWEKTKPVPEHVTEQRTLEDRIPDLMAVIDEVISVEKTPGMMGATVVKRRPNYAGIKTVLIRFAKNLKKSLD